MAEATQYAFNWAEVTEILIKKQDIHEGEWTSVVEFAITAGVVGHGEAEARPGMIVLANGLQLMKVQPNAPRHLVVDAAKVNPR
jgi:hypothetical protein